MDTGVRRNSPNRDSSSKNLSNTPLPVHIYGLLGMLDHVEYLGRTGETGRMHAERALRFDPSDRFASAVLDTAPAADGSTGLAELADIAQDRGTIR